MELCLSSRSCAHKHTYLKEHPYRQNAFSWGAWVVQWVKASAFGSGHDLRVLGLSDPVDLIFLALQVVSIEYLQQGYQ